MDIEELHFKGTTDEGVASHSGYGANRKDTHMVLTVAELSSVGFKGPELSASSSWDAVERSDMEGVEMMER